ncbi:MAG: ABC transporter permease, partial [Oscillospiraceae bacterium]|nr:ABC transporter permease [Oscillospiraceae bacterium]
MKIYDLLRMSLGNLSRRKGRTALTVIGVVVGICAIVVLISLGLAINANNEEMLQSWGDLTKIEIYNWGGSPNGQDVPTLDDEMLGQIKTWDHVAAVSPQYQPQNLNGNILSGKNGRYSQYLWNTCGMYTDAIEAMGVQLIDGEFLRDDMNLGKNKIPVLVGENMAYQFEDTRRSWNSSKRWVYQGQVDAMGNPVPPFVDVNKDKMTLRVTAWDKNGNEKSQDFDLVVVGTMLADYNAGYFTDSGLLMRISDIQMLEKVYQKLSGEKPSSGGTVTMYSSGGAYTYNEGGNGYQQVYVKVDDVDNVAEVEQQLKDLGYETWSMTQIRE